MTKLFCAIVGVPGSAFSVRVDEADSVDELKDAIKVKKVYQFPADELQLYLAKTTDGKWLSSRSEDVTKLKEGQTTAIIEALTKNNQELQGEDSLEVVLNGMDPPSYQQVHVLVVIPKQKQQLRGKDVHDLVSDLKVLHGASGDWSEEKILAKPKVRQRENDELVSLPSYIKIVNQKLDFVDQKLDSVSQKMGQKMDLVMEVKIVNQKLDSVSQKMDSVMEVVTDYGKKNRQSYSVGALGELEISSLRERRQINNFAPVVGAEAFWSEEIQTQANAISDEAVFDAFITPFISNVLHSCGMVFVNSERYQWLSQSPLVTKKTDLKPDGFATHRGMFRAKPAPSDGVQRPDDFRFGVAEEELFDCIILFESKLTITSAAFGQVVRYLQCPGFEEGSAVLFDRRSFWLITGHKNSPDKVKIANWVDKGSKALFQNFISENMSPWVTRLSEACISFGIDVVEGDSFLGRGAYGRVFKVTGQDGEVFALKIMGNHKRLRMEKTALTIAQHTGLTIRLVKTLIATSESAALLLSPVGKTLPQPTTREEVLDLFELLWQLHKIGLAHGDPRVPNVIVIEKKHLWIDLVEVTKADPVSKQDDAEILTRSILCVSRSTLLDPTLKQLIDNYGKNATQENINQLAEQVYQNLAAGFFKP